MAKTIYVAGGTNGVGKSTIRKDLLDPQVPYINADFIAKEMKGGQSSLMLAELAREYGSGRVERGKHYIPPEEVLLRYENGNKLLAYYFSMPEILVFIDNSRSPLTCMLAEKGVIDYRKLAPFKWVERILLSLETTEPSVSPKAFDSVEDVRRLYYSRMRKN